MLTIIITMHACDRQTERQTDYFVKVIDEKHTNIVKKSLKRYYLNKRLLFNNIRYIFSIYNMS